MSIALPTHQMTETVKGHDLLGAAIALVSDDGYSGLTLRPLARSLGVSVTVLTKRFGARDDILATIIAQARIADRAYHGIWDDRLSGLRTVDAHAMTAIADAVLHDYGGLQRGLSRLFLECLQASTWDETLSRTFGAWSEDREAFWARIGRRSGLPEGVMTSGFLMGYVVDETAYSVALADLTEYQMLRRLCLRRLFMGPAHTDGNQADNALFDLLFDATHDPAEAHHVSHGTEFPGGWHRAAARACAILVTTRGVGAVTHRAVAAMADLPPTTLAYRFASQESLVVAGLDYIITHLLRSVDDAEARGSGDLVKADPLEGLDVGRATFAVAIAAVRSKRLAACAADMRRRRGINLFRILGMRHPGHPRLDRLSAQVLAIGCIGAANRRPVAEDNRRLMGQALDAASDWVFGDGGPLRG